MKAPRKYTITLPTVLEPLLEDNFHDLTSWPATRQIIPESPGLYAFWWFGDTTPLQGHQDVQFVGPAVAEEDEDGEPINGHNPHTSSFVIPEEDRLLVTEPICLYIGKTTDLRRRIRVHQMVSLNSNAFLEVKNPNLPAGVERTPLYNQQVSTVFKRNSACQFRAGMEYLYRHRSLANPEIVREAVRNNVKISFIELSNQQVAFEEGQDAFKRRFYWEDLLIGVLQPWFNLDGER